MSKNLLVITYYFPPLGGVGVQRITKFCKYLPEFAYHPMVVAPQPSVFYAEDRKMLSEVRKASIHRAAGVDSFRLRQKLVGPLKPRIDSPWRWFSRRFSWPDAQTGFIPAAFRTALKLTQKAHAIFATSPPWSTLLLARLLKRVSELPLIVDMRDPWVSHPEHDRLRWKRALNRRSERNLVEDADAVTAVTEEHTRDLRRRYPYLASRIHYLPNGYDTQDFKPKPRKDVRKKPLVISYAGILGLGNINRGTTLYTALRRLRDEDGITPSHLQLHLMGQLSAVEEERIRRSGVSTFVKYKGHIPHRKAMGNLAASDLTWFGYHSEYSRLIVPGKLYEYMGSGTPVLAEVDPSHEAARLVRKTGTGMVVQEGDVEGTLNALRLLLKGCFPYSPQKKVIQNFERRHQTEKLAEIIEEVTGYG